MYESYMSHRAHAVPAWRLHTRFVGCSKRAVPLHQNVVIVIAEQVLPPLTQLQKIKKNA